MPAAAPATREVPHPPDPPHAPHTARRLPTLIVLGLLSAFGPLSMDGYLPSLPRVVTTLHTSSALVQVSLTASLVGLAVGQLFAGPASDRHGRRPVLMTGLVVFIAASAGCALAPGIWPLIAARLVQGCAGATGIAVSRAVIRDLYAGRALARILSRLLVVSGSAPVIAPLLGAQVLALGGWRAVFWGLTGVGALLLLLTLALVPETLGSERRTDNSARATVAIYRRILHSPDALPYVLATGCFSGVLFGFISGSPFVVQKIYGHSATVFSLVFAAISAVMIANGQINARMVRRHSLRRLTEIAVVTAVTGSLLMLVCGLAGTDVGLWLVVVALILAASPNAVVFPNCTALVLHKHPENAGVASGLMGLATFLVGGLVSPIVGAGGGHTAVPMGIVMSVSALGALAALTLLGRRH